MAPTGEGTAIEGTTTGAGGAIAGLLASGGPFGGAVV
jgi:hypothetical protein